MKNLRSCQQALPIVILTSLIILSHLASGQPLLAGTNGQCDGSVPNRSSLIDQTHVRVSDGAVKTQSQDDCTGVVPTINNQWVESATSTGGGPFSSISAQWTVPNGPNPSSPTGQTLIYFDGLQGYLNGGSQLSILQPVLAWGPIGGCLIGGNYWYIVSVWYISGGPCSASPIAYVNINDQITGSVTWVTSGCNGNGRGGSGYLVNTNDNSLNQAVYRYVCSSTKDATAVASVFEAWNLNYCNQLPQQSADTFSSISVSPSVTSWGVSVDTSDSPQCNYNIYEAAIHFHSYPTTDFYTRSHGMTIDQSLVAPWWPPYGNKEFRVSGSAFDYYYYLGAPGTIPVTLGSHYVQEAASGFCPSYCWYTQTYVNGALIAQGNVDRNAPLNANFNVNSWTLTWSYS